MRPLVPFVPTAADGPPPSLFETAAIVPAQLAARSRPADGPRRLAAAVLTLALLDLDGKGTYQGGQCGVKTAEQRSRHRESAIAWVESDADDWPFSFVNLCRSLDLDPSAVRAALASRAAA